MKACTLASGSSGNAILLKGSKDSVLIDAGMSGKAIEQNMQAIEETCCNLSAVLVTHEHNDHIKGIGVLARRYDLPVYVTEKTWDCLQFSLGKIPAEQVNCFQAGESLEVGSLKIETFSISHDAIDPVGYVVHDWDCKVSVVTDTGCMTSEIVKKIQGSDYYIMEANHDVDMLQRGSYPWHLKKRILSSRGHLSNVVSGHSLASLVSGQTKGIALAHLSQENNDPGLAFKTVAKILADNGLHPGDDIDLAVAPRHCPGAPWISCSDT